MIKKHQIALAIMILTGGATISKEALITAQAPRMALKEVIGEILKSMAGIKKAPVVRIVKEPHISKELEEKDLWPSHALEEKAERLNFKVNAEIRALTKNQVAIIGEADKGSE